MKIIIGNQNPILGECVHYSLQDSFIDKYASGNTFGSFDITPKQTVRWKLTNNEGFRLYKDEGTFTFNQPAMGKTYLLEAEYTAVSGAKETASLIIKPLAGKPKIQRVYWTDTDHQLIGNWDVGYLDHY